ncbi:hypothetical protein K7H20_13850 [Salipiger manganoxidans]|uniref:hypothetical protein n=1 Tax=Salipiger marinus TaxID=555512 RepID=UPI001E5291B6|nr:hypothetical protein [Salipiger manganoxidans]MCD1619149.1 hypothetical protein [Salipiger manganoxidans]
MTPRPYITAATATPRAVEAALDAAFRAIGKPAPVPEVQPVDPVALSPLMQRIVAAMPVGEAVTARDLAARIGSSPMVIFGAISDQRARLPAHGLVISSKRGEGYTLRRIGGDA